MAEQPAGTPDAHPPQDWWSIPVSDQPGMFHPLAAFPLVRERPRVVVRADLLPALRLLVGVALIGFPLGWLWSWLAPTQQVQVFSGDRLIPLPPESYHRFDDLAVFVLIGFGAGLLTGVAAWLVRTRRGPVALLAAVAGSLLAAWIAAQIGLAIAGASHPIPAQPQVGAIFAQSPRLESVWAMLAQPMAAALAYGIASAWNGMDDLERAS